MTSVVARGPAIIESAVVKGINNTLLLVKTC